MLTYKNKGFKEKSVSTNSREKDKQIHENCIVLLLQKKQNSNTESTLTQY